MCLVHQTAAVLYECFRVLASNLPIVLAAQVQNVIDMPANDKLSLFEASRCVMSRRMPSCHARMMFIHNSSGNIPALWKQNE